MTSDDLISVSDAAKILDITPRMVRYLIRQGELSGYKLTPRAWALSRHEVESYRESKKKEKDNHE